jgi:hypothetical protein
MNPIRRELLNGLFVLVVASLLSAGLAAFQVEFNLQLWALILTGAAIAVSGYIVFDFVLSTEAREKALAEAMRLREEQWLKRVGTPARLELGMTYGGPALRLQIDAVKALKPGSDLTIMLYFDREGGAGELNATPNEARKTLYDSIVQQLSRGTIREYKRVICFDRDVLANDRELHSGILRVGAGPGTVNRSVAEHCRLMIETKGCSVFVAPVIMRNYVALWGSDKASMSVDTVDRETGARSILGMMFFHDPPNGEIVEQIREVVRETEKRMVAVHKVVYPEDEPSAAVAARSPSVR